MSFCFKLSEFQVSLVLICICFIANVEDTSLLCALVMLRCINSECVQNIKPQTSLNDSICKVCIILACRSPLCRSGGDLFT